jgi:hypothetical protein
MKRITNGLAFGLCLMVLTGCFSFGNSPAKVMEVVLGDLDGDGYLDVFIANGRTGEPYTYPEQIQYQILYNDGQGDFPRRGQLPQTFNNRNAALGDLDGDGSLDIVTVHPAMLLFFNDGSGGFSRHNLLREDPLYGTSHGGVALADLNGDGHLDLFKANCCGAVAFNHPEEPRLIKSLNMVWLNDGGGNFRGNQAFGEAGSHHLALGDLNGNGFIDAFIANGQTAQNDPSNQFRPILAVPNEVWFNDGEGFFSDSGQRLGLDESFSVALGDVSGDGFLDAAIGNRGADEIWLNDGSGNFSPLDQRFENGLTRRVFLLDLNGNGHLDLFAAGETRGRIWFNDGAGQFVEGSQQFSYGQYDGLALGDLNNNGAIDLFIAGINTYQVWLNDGSGHFARP